MNLARHAPEVRAYYCNLTDAGGSISTATLGALSAFVNRLKAHATLWDKLDEIYPLCGRGIASACVKLKFIDVPLMTNNGFADEDFEEWGPTAGLAPDGASKFLDTNFPATSLRDDAHLCYIEQQPAVDAAVPRTAIGVTDGSLEWSIGAIDAFNDRAAILGSPLSLAITPGAYSDWTSFYIANRESPTSLTLFKRTHLKDTDTVLSATNPKPSLNVLICARNNAGVADQHFKNRLRFASIGQAFTEGEIADFYQAVQVLQDACGRSI
jgi:hypothetical protein